MTNEDLAFEEIMDYFSEENIEKLNKEIKESKDGSYLETNKADKNILEFNEEVVSQSIKFEEKKIKQEPIIVYEKLEPELTKEQELEKLKKEGFNEQQLKVINSEYPIVNIAGPGSGKTKTLIQKIVSNEVRELEDLKNILVLTFTNAASNEILERLGKKFHTELDRRDFYSGTYHGIFYKLIKENSEKLKIFGFRETPRILDSNEDKHLFESIANMILDKEGAFKKKDIKEKFTNEHGFMPLDIYYQINHIINSIPKSIKEIKDKIIGNSISSDIEELKKIELIIHNFFKVKIESNVFGFSDILMYMHFLLEKDSEFKTKIQDKFKHILVDEYQDTNPIQAKILDNLEKNNNTCVIGDPYQSIYRFLGAYFQNIMNKSKQEGMNTIQLIKNYRSTPNIVSFTNDIAKLFNERVQNYVPCESAATGLKNMKVFLKEGVSQEFNIIRELKYRLNQGIELKDMAVLARTNFETYKLEASLRKDKIPFIKLGGNELYETKEVKFMIDLAKVVAGEYSLQNFENVAEQFKGLGSTTIEKLKNAYLSRSDINLTIVDMIDKEFAKNKSLQKFKDVVFGNIKKSDMESLFFEKKDTDIIRNFSFETFQSIMKDENIDIENILVKDAETINKKREIESNIKYFNEELKNYFEQGKENLIEFLNDISLGQNDVPNEKDRDNALTISTIHGAKGKEWNDVYILNLEEGKFPSNKSKNEALPEDERIALMEEEKRLLYVAVSRAKEKLVLMSENALNDFIQPLVKKPYIDHYKSNKF